MAGTNVATRKLEHNSVKLFVFQIVGSEKKSVIGYFPQNPEMDFTISSAHLPLKPALDM
jgi:ABC-type Mn2+/Zn2+ transport system ATPase subunit